MAAPPWRPWPYGFLEALCQTQEAPESWDKKKQKYVKTRVTKENTMKIRKPRSRARQPFLLIWNLVTNKNHCRAIVNCSAIGVDTSMPPAPRCPFLNIHPNSTAVLLESHETHYLAALAASFLYPSPLQLNFFYSQGRAAARSASSPWWLLGGGGSSAWLLSLAVPCRGLLARALTTRWCTGGWPSVTAR